MSITKKQKKAPRAGQFQKGHSLSLKLPEERKERRLVLPVTESQFQEALQASRDGDWPSITKWMRYTLFGIDERKENPEK